MTRLVFIHGWGFDAGFWHALIPHLSAETVAVECGFLGAMPTAFVPQPDDCLIGHSLGFHWGWHLSQHWQKWVAINSFASFCGDEGGVPLATLRAMNRRLGRDPHGTLVDFYRLIAATPPAHETLNLERLALGLNQLLDSDMKDYAPLLAATVGMILASQHDPLIAATASQALQNLASHAALHLHDKAGHLLPQQYPAWCAAHLTNFLNS